MSQQSIFARLAEGVNTSDKEAVLAAVEEALQAGVPPLDIIDKGLSPGMKEIGERFARYEIFLPEMMLAAEAFEEAMKILEPKLLASGSQPKKIGRVVIGTVNGDIHSIGKNMVSGMLKMNGFEVFDLGINVPASHFVTKAEEVAADIVAASALMTTTMPQQKDIVEHFTAKGVRGKYCILVGGCSTSQEWADQIGADGYGKTAHDAVTLALGAVSRKKGG